jgi:thiol-disulfide isomerase/thioredoxin
MRLVFPLLLSACAHQAVLDRLTAVEQRLAVMEDALGLSAPRATEAEEEAAAKLYQEAATLARNDAPAARASLQALIEAHPNTYAAQAAAELFERIALVGTTIEGLDGVRWLQGDGALSDDKVTLLVFWEVWCPHCQRFVPELQPVADRYAERGLQVLSLTRMSRDVNEDQVRAFVAEHALKFPVGHEDGTMSKRLDVAGVPAAAALRGTTVLWRGHPGEIDDAMLEGWLKR